MTKVKLALLGMLAVYAISIVASSTASAALQEFWDCQKVGTSEGRWNNSHCTTRGTGEEWKTRGLAGTETKGVVGTSGVSELEGEVLKTKVVIRCGRDTFTGILMAGGASSGKVVFEECTVESPKGMPRPHCVIPGGKITFEFVDQLIHNATTGAIEDKFEGILEGGKTFVEITIEESGGPCPVKVNKGKVEGTQTCELPNATQSLITHQIVCKPSGSNLTFDTAPATFTSEEHINVIGGPQWGAA